MRNYRSIKELVLDFVHRCRGRVDYEALTRAVKKLRPNSRWDERHWYWYRNQIVRSRFKEQFSEAERLAVSQSKAPRKRVAVTPTSARADSTRLTRGPAAKDPEVKRLGDAILGHVRLVVSLAAGDDVDKGFRLKRWVFSRLQQDEVRVKRPIKKALWEKGIHNCQVCGKEFASLKGVELHRKDEAKGYSVDNCELLCRDCHEEMGKE